MAVGASRGRSLPTVLKGALAQLATGLAVGLPAAYAGRLLQTTLFRVSGHDPLVLGVSVAILAVAAIVAALVPARRAATLDPARALRME